MPKDSPPALHLWRPLRHARFRQLWLARFVSHLGMSLQAFAAAWLMARQSVWPMHTALVQTAAFAPVLLLSLPAGVLADHVERPRLLLWVHAAMALCATMLGVLTAAGTTGVGLLLLLSTAMGVGVALSMPAWQAGLSSLVPEAGLADAVALNNLSFNLAQLLGPALAGCLFERMGAALLFLANGLCFAGLLYGFARWAQEDGGGDARVHAVRREPLRASWRRAWGSHPFRRLLCLAAGVFCAGTALPSLLPLLVRDSWQGDAKALGHWLVCFGAGAVAGALALPLIRRAMPLRAALLCALAGQTLMLIALPWVEGWARACLLLQAGVAWCVLISSLNTLAQQAFEPAWRARSLSVYLLLAAAGQTLGSLCWGGLAAALGLAPSLGLAGVLMIACVPCLRGPLPVREWRRLEC